MPIDTQILILCILGIVVVLMVAVGWALRLPLVIYRTQRFNGTPTLEQFDLDESPPPGKAGKYFRAMDKQFVALGFQCLDCLALPDPLPNVRALIVVYGNRETKDLATATMMYGIDVDTGLVNQCTSYVEIMSHFRDDDCHLILTNNVEMLGSFPASKGVRTYRFPHVDKIDKLFDLHCKLIERDEPDGEKYVRLTKEFRGDCRAYLQAALQESYEKQLATGYLTRDSDSSDFRPTLKGAMLMTWAQQSPLKEYLWNNVQKNALRLEQELL